MTLREKAVLRAIIESLRTRKHRNMDALATSYPVPVKYGESGPECRAALLLQALVDNPERE